MRFSHLTCALMAASCCAVGLPQAAIPEKQSAGLELLTRVAQKYTDAKSYSIELVEERNSSSEYNRSYQKTVLKAAEAPGNRYYFEGSSVTGSALTMADGKTAWSYHIGQQSYTQKPQAANADDPMRVRPQSEFALNEAKYVRQRWGAFAKNLKFAELLPDENLILNGSSIPCHVVRVRSSDEKRTRGSYSYDKKVWIDARREVFLKVEERSQNPYTISPGMQIEGQDTLTIQKVELDAPLPDSLFTFVPPADARLLAEFPDPMTDVMSTSLIGHPIPSLKFKSADGKVTPIESLRGKPVLLDFWATWCAPCVASLPHLAKIDEDARVKGLAVITVDQDEEAKTASDLFLKKGYGWQNYHDGDGAIEKLMGTGGIPRTILVDAEGQVAFDSTAATEDQLRTEIAKLGPQFASLAPKSVLNPCSVPKAETAQK